MKSKLVAAIAAVIMAFGVVAPTGTTHPSTTSPPELSATASLIAGHPVQATCYDIEEHVDAEHMDPYHFYGAWGYFTDALPNEIHLAKEVCDGALSAVHRDNMVPTWLQAVGVWVLTHEALHAKKWKRWDSESWVECFAIKQFRRSAASLGLSSAEVENLVPTALAFHYRQGIVFPKYNLPSCKVPWFYGPDGPRG